MVAGKRSDNHELDRYFGRKFRGFLDEMSQEGRQNPSLKGEFLMKFLSGMNRSRWNVHPENSCLYIIYRGDWKAKEVRPEVGIR
jgi:hypothetical protein